MKLFFSYVLYYIGCMICFFMETFHMFFLYKFYNYIMCKSADLDGAGKLWQYTDEDRSTK